MNELIFMVEEAPEGGFVARALEESLLPKPTRLPSCLARFVMQCFVTSRKGRLRKSSVFTISHLRLTTYEHGEHHLTISLDFPLRYAFLIRL